jgi:membrane protease YdiL (CAAX protease family)
MSLRENYQRLPPGLTALIEVGMLFLPAIPTYLWVWPHVEGLSFWVFQCLVYVYVFVGTLFIGLRRWNLTQLGINRSGIGLSLVCALFMLAGRLLIIRSVDLGLSPPQYNFAELIGGFLFYFGSVALVEELLYRGLVYQALDEWLGTRWAIWGSSLGFLLWHIFGQGPVIGLTAFFIGLIFALLRWRAGGIVGLILLHGLFDMQSFLIVSDSNRVVLNTLDSTRPEIINPISTFLGVGLILFIPLYLWLLYPRVPWLSGQSAKG